MSSQSGFSKPYIVIPTYNERANIPQLIADILRWDMGFHILVVDDHSPDGTGELVDRIAKDTPTVHVLHRSGKLGLGTAYLDGFRRALQDGADLIFEMDADYSHDPKLLPLFLEQAKTHDVVIGSRYLTGISVVNWPLRRLALSLIANLYVQKILKMSVKDCTSGYKCYRREVLEAIDFSQVRSSGYAFQIEMKYRAFRAGFRLVEIPIIFIDRRIGDTKMSKAIAWEAIWTVWRLKMASLRGRLPARSLSTRPPR